MADIQKSESTLVKKVWDIANVLAAAGVGFTDYITQLTYILFLKMDAEKEELGLGSSIPEGYKWKDIAELNGDDLIDKYEDVLKELSKDDGLIGTIFTKASNKINSPVHLAKVLQMVGNENWYMMEGDFKGAIYESILEKNGQDKKSGAGQYFTPRSLIKAMVEVSQQIKIYEQAQSALCVVDGISSDKEDLLKTINNAKAKILNLAIRGQLVPQDPADEPASVLLERIRAEKEELIKQGKIKRDKKESVIFRGEDNSYYEKIGMEVRCINSEIPFDLPETWCWCRLGTLFAHNTGKALNSSDSAGTPMTYITTSNLYWDRFELDSLKEMPFTDSEIDKCTVTKGDLLVCEGGDIGRSAIWMFAENIRIQNHIHRLRPYISLSSRFYYYVMYMWKQLGLIGGQGIGLQGFSSKALHNLIVPLPSIDEQERMVDFVDELFETIANIERSLS